MPWLIAITFLLAYEWYALTYGKPTLSRMVWRGSKAWPLLPFLVGLVIGGLAVHFWWIPFGCDPTKGF